LNRELLTKVPLFISVDAAKTMLNHCYDDGREKEAMGLIIGKTYQYGKKIVSFVKDAVTSELDATEVNVKFDSFEKLFDRLDKLNYDYQIVGWYHSHPDYSSFMSPTDVQTQAHMFKLKYQYAVIIDPIRHEMKAFSLNQRTKDKAIERGFAIIDYKD